MASAVFAQHLPLVGNSSGTTVYIDPCPIDAYNNSRRLTHTNAYFNNSGTGAGVVTVEQGNDAVNSFAVGGSGTVDNTVGKDVFLAGDANDSFCRLKMTVSGDADWCVYNIDVHVSIKRA